MKIGIIGLSLSGKTTLFSAFMGTGLPSEGSKQTTGVVNVPDKRLERLTKLFNPKKKVYANVIFEDCICLDTPVKPSRVKLYETLKIMDAFVVVIGAYRYFEAKEVLEEFEKAYFELIINDLDFVVKRIERLEREMRVNSKDKTIKESEMALLKRLQPVLEKEESLYGMDFSEQESSIMANYNLLTTKPLLFAINISQETKKEKVTQIIKEAEELTKGFRVQFPVIAVNASLESEVAAMEPDEIEEFLKEFEIDELGRDKVIRGAYKLMDLITFFTVGEDECRSWNLRRGRTAVDAAGTIHSDLARGFIRAEVIDCETLLSLGSLNEAKKIGKLRLEGKTYLVKDGDIVHVMFNV